MDGIKSIVVATDFTPCSAAALRQAIRIAKWNQASVRVVHVIDTLVAIELGRALSQLQQTITDGLISDARKAWESFAAAIEGAAALPFDACVNNRIVGILAAARDANADLLVLGAYGTRHPDVGMGTVATACVRNSPSRVLIVREGQTDPFRTVVACVDLSETSRDALETAARIAGQDDARLHVLHVFDAPWHQLHYRAPTPQATPEFQTQFRTGLQGRVEAFVAEMGHTVSFLKPTIALHDAPRHRSGIVDYAAMVSADLIVLGTRGRSNLRDMLLGSTAERALSESECSVLAVKPRDVSHRLGAGSET